MRPVTSHSIFLEVFNLMSFRCEKEFDTRNEIVNNAIRICVECGNMDVLIDEQNIFCKHCNSQFKIMEKI